MRLWAAGLACWAALSGPAAAYVPAPGAAEIAEATRLGAALAEPYRGYPVQDYLLYAVGDALALDPSAGCVDAVQVATPFERTRHASFLAALARRPIGPEAAREAAAFPDGALAFTIFAHGAAEDDQDFLQRFSPPQLTFAGRAARLTGQDRSPTFRDIYPHAPASDRERQVGTVTFRFQLDPASLADGRGVLSFTDACAKAFRLPVDLARYR